MFCLNLDFVSLRCLNLDLCVIKTMFVISHEEHQLVIH